MSVHTKTSEEMHCDMAGCSNVVKDLGMREGYGAYTIEEIAIDAGWSIDQEGMHMCPRCARECGPGSFEWKLRQVRDCLKEIVKDCRPVVPMNRTAIQWMIDTIGDLPK